MEDEPVAAGEERPNHLDLVVGAVEPNPHLKLARDADGAVDVVLLSELDVLGGNPMGERVRVYRRQSAPPNRDTQSNTNYSSIFSYGPIVVHSQRTNSLKGKLEQRLAHSRVMACCIEELLADDGGTTHCVGTLCLSAS